MSTIYFFNHFCEINYSQKYDVLWDIFIKLLSNYLMKSFNNAKIFLVYFISIFCHN